MKNLWLMTIGLMISVGGVCSGVILERMGHLADKFPYIIIPGTFLLGFGMTFLLMRSEVKH